MHEYLVAPARKRPELWRLALGMVLGTVAYMLLLAAFFGLLSVILSVTPEVFLTASTPQSVLIMLASFLAMTLAVWGAAKFLQKRSLGSLIGPWPLVIQDFWATFKIAVVIIALGAFLPDPIGLDLVPNLALGQWIIILPLAVILLFVQISAEELVFRGYFQSQMAARFESPLIWMVIPAICFGVAHYDPSSAGGNAPLVALWAIFYGLMLADITARAGNLGPALALHFVNNFAAILLIAPQGDLSALALYKYPYDLTDPAILRTLLPIELAFMGVMWLAARVAIKR